MRISSTDVGVRYFDLEGYYRITWYGRVSTLPTDSAPPRLTAYLAPLEVFQGKLVSPRITRKPERRSIPAGDVPILPINTIIDGQNIIRPFGKVFEPFSIRPLTLNFNQSNIHPFLRLSTDENGQLILPCKVPWALDDPEYAGMMIGIGDGDDPYSVVIPCFEVYRFFYATSSKLANVFLDSRFLDPERHLWSPDRSKIDLEQRSARLWLRQKMIDSDAKAIAAFAFSKYAVEQGKNIFLKLSQSTGLNERVLQALPPFEGITNVSAECISFVSPTGQNRTLITRLVTCSWNLPFDELKYDRDNDGRRPETPTGNTTPIRRGGGGKGVSGPEEKDESKESDSDSQNKDESNVNLWADEPSSNFQPQEIVHDELIGRFPQIERIPAEKLPQLETKHHSAKEVRKQQTERWNKELSTIEGKNSRSTLGSVIFTGVVPSLLAYNTEPDKYPIQQGSELLNLAKGLLNISNGSLTEIEFLPAFEPVQKFGKIAIFTLPTAIHRMEWPWFYHDRKKRIRRKGFVAEISVKSEYGYRFRYVLDFEEKGGKHSSIVVVSGESEEQLSRDTLVAIIAAFAMNGGVKLQHPPIQGLNIRHRNHRKDPGALDKILRRIMSD